MFSNPITYTLQVPSHMLDAHADWFGETWVLTEAEKPLKMTYRGGTIRKPTRLSLAGEGEFLGFVFNLGNAVECSFPGHDQMAYRFKRHQYALVYLPDASCCCQLMKGPVSVLWIHYPDYLFNLGVEDYPLIRHLMACVDAGQSCVLLRKPLDIPRKVLRVIDSVLYSKQPPSLRDTFFYIGLSDVMFKCFEHMDAKHGAS